MIIDIPNKIYRQYFRSDPHPYISDQYLDQHRDVADRYVRLVQGNGSISMGLVAGIINKGLKSPCPAPFGGFHFKNNLILINGIAQFIGDLKEFSFEQGLKRIDIILPPDIYHQTINSKLVHSFIQNGYSMSIPEITNWVNLTAFDGTFIHRQSNESLRTSIRNKLSFMLVSDEALKLEAYKIIVKNREMYGRQIHLTFSELLERNKIFPVDFFLVRDSEGESVGAAIFYRGHKKIVQAIFWGDTLAGRALKTMDFLVMNLYKYYKELGFEYIDLGISTESGSPNEGLLHFKESHNCISSLRYTFSWVN